MIDTNVPNALEIEVSVLYSVINEFDNLMKAMNILKPKHFYARENQIIFKAIADLYEDNQPIDLFTLMDYLKKIELLESIGGMKYLSKITSSVSVSQIEFHCKILVEKWMLRELISTSHKIAQIAYTQTEDVFDLTGRAIADLEQIMSVTESSKDELNFWDRLPKLIDQIIKDRDENKDAGIKSVEFPSFNHATLGLKPGNIVLITGKYKSGKTRFGLSLSRDLAVNIKVPIGIIGLEMDVEEYDKNLLSMQTGIRYGYLRDPAAKNRDGSHILKDEHIKQLNEKAAKYFKDTRIYICDRVFTDTQAINKIKYWKKKFGVKVVLFDYLQLLENTKDLERRDLIISDMSKRFKILCRQEGINVILLSQENKEGTSADSSGPIKDCDFWFSISHPVDDGVKSIRINGEDITTDESIFQVKFKASRHSANGGKFICKFYENGEFKELSTESYGEVI